LEGASGGLSDGTDITLFGVSLVKLVLWGVGLWFGGSFAVYVINDAAEQRRLRNRSKEEIDRLHANSPFRFYE
jgi:hypothetical protein